MKALMMREYMHLEIEDIPVPQIGPEEVLIQVRACGICGSDIHGLDGSSGRRIPPLVMGHEAAGVITEVGANVAGWKLGDRVTFDSTIYCGHCHFCRRGEINLCDNRRVLGVSCDEYRQFGAFAEYVAVPQHILYRLPEGLSFEHASMVEPLSVAVHAVERTPVALNDTAVVVGTGTIGLLVIQALRAAGCGTIVGIDLLDERLGLARKLGADVTLNPKAVDCAAEILKLTEGRGADIVIDAVGIPATVDLCIRSVRKGGAVTLVGNLTPSVALALQKVVARELTVYGSCASRGEYPACLGLMARGTINVQPLISAVAPLEEGPIWFPRLYRQEPGLLKVVLKP